MLGKYSLLKALGNRFSASQVVSTTAWRDGMLEGHGLLRRFGSQVYGSGC